MVKFLVHIISEQPLKAISLMFLDLVWFGNWSGGGMAPSPVATPLSIAFSDGSLSPSLSRHCCMPLCFNPLTNRFRSISWKIVPYLQCAVNCLGSARYSAIESSGFWSRLFTLNLSAIELTLETFYLPVCLALINFLVASTFILWHLITK